jgi:uncharacterized protein (DUF3084 family)
MRMPSSIVVAYRRLSEVEHGWNYNRQQLDLTREEVNTRTHAIIHLEHTIEQQDLKLKERAATITTLEQELQLQAPPTPVEPDTVSDANEE